VARHEKRFEGSIGLAVQPSIGSSRMSWYSFRMRLIACLFADILMFDVTALVAKTWLDICALLEKER